jgi:hypothetical protein
MKGLGAPKMLRAVAAALVSAAGGLYDKAIGSMLDQQFVAPTGGHRGPFRQHKQKIKWPSPGNRHLPFIGAKQIARGRKISSHDYAQQLALQEQYKRKVA